MDGREIKQRREAAHLTQQRLAELLKVSVRSIGNWESGATVPRSRLGALRAVLGADEGLGPRVDEASDVELLLELMRRANARQQPSGAHPVDVAHPAEGVVLDFPDIEHYDKAAAEEYREPIGADTTDRDDTP